MHLVDVEEVLEVRNKLRHHEFLADFKGLHPLATPCESRSKAIDYELLIEQVGVLVELNRHETYRDLPAHAGQCELYNLDEMLHEGMVLARLLRVDALDGINDSNLHAAS